MILLHTFSKTYAMTGWRLGYVVAPGEMGTLLFSVHRAIDGPICTFVQRAGAAALRGSQDCARGAPGNPWRPSILVPLAFALAMLAGCSEEPPKKPSVSANLCVSLPNGMTLGPYDTRQECNTARENMPGGECKPCEKAPGKP